MPNASFTRAEIQIEGGQTISCWLNPKEISVSKSNNWSADATAGQSMGLPQFTGGQPRSMTVELMFDKSVAVGPATVKQTVDTLMQAMEASITQQLPPRTGRQGGGGGGSGGGSGAQNRNTRRPPTMTFSWGSLMEPFTAVCKSLTVKYQLMDPTGEPLRATANLTLEQAAPASAAGQRTNPTTRSVPGLGAHVVKDGDSLPGLAYDYYGDATKWRPIAEANGVDDPLRLRRGAPLLIPRID